MSQKKAEFWFKFLVVLGIIFELTGGIIALLMENVERGSYEDVVSNMFVIVFVLLGGVCCGLIYYLMGKVDLKKIRVNATKYILNTNNYQDFMSTFITTLKEQDYNIENDIPNTLDSEMNYYIRKKHKVNDIILIIKTTEVSDELKEQYFETALNYIVEKEPYLVKKNTNLIHIICVDRMNDNFRDIVNTNTVQGYGRFNLPVGISFGSRTIYVASQKEGFFYFRYKELKQEFLKYIDKQLWKEEE